MSIIYHLLFLEYKNFYIFLSYIFYLWSLTGSNCWHFYLILYLLFSTFILIVCTIIQRQIPCKWKNSDSFNSPLPCASINFSPLITGKKFIPTRWQYSILKHVDRRERQQWSAWFYGEQTTCCHHQFVRYQRYTCQCKTSAFSKLAWLTSIIEDFCFIFCLVCCWSVTLLYRPQRQT